MRGYPMSQTIPSDFFPYPSEDPSLAGEPDDFGFEWEAPEPDDYLTELDFTVEALSERDAEDAAHADLAASQMTALATQEVEHYN